MTEKQLKTFNVLNIVLKVLCAFFILGLFLQVVCMLWLTLVPDKLSGFFEKVEIWRPFITDMYPFKQATAELCVSMLSYSFAVFFTKNASDIFSKLSKSEDIPVNVVKKLAIFSLVCFVLLPIVHIIAFGVLVGDDFLKFTPNFSLLVLGIFLFGIARGLVREKE